jgi:hypothetical protein
MNRYIQPSGSAAPQTRLLLSTLSIVLAGTLTGCITHDSVLPPLIPVDAAKLPAIKTQHGVTVVALHSQTAQAVEWSVGIHTYPVRLDDLTDAAAASLKDILKRKNIAVSEAGDRRLEVSVVQADTHDVGFGHNLVVGMQVRAGSQAVRKFTGVNYFPRLNVEENASQAMNNALLQMLKDENIVRYLED